MSTLLSNQQTGVDYNQDRLAKEHDSCGVSIAAHKDGIQSRRIPEIALRALDSMEHRAGINGDKQSSDGAGVMFGIPQKFMKNQWIGLTGTDPGDARLGAASLFLPQDPTKREQCIAAIEKVLTKADHKFVWRDVPINQDVVGRIAKDSQPHIAQLLIQRKDGFDDIAFDNNLYDCQREIEKIVSGVGISGPGADYFGFSSMSAYTIIYKGMVTGKNFVNFFPDVQDELFESELAITHNRFSTNTRSYWHNAQPFESLAHNGEINTIQGNLRWLSMHEQLLRPRLGPAADTILPLDPSGLSDSGVMSKEVRLMMRAGDSPDVIKLKLMGEKFQPHPDLPDEENKKLEQMFRVYNAEWEEHGGPAFQAITNGRKLVLSLDRNGLRPMNLEIMTKDGIFIAASEAGFIDVMRKEVIYDNSLQPGGMTVIDFERGQVFTGDEALLNVANSENFEASARDIVDFNPAIAPSGDTINSEEITLLQRLSGWSNEDVTVILDPTVKEAKEPLVSMGDDAPPAFMYETHRRFSAYLRQDFAQVTNPPIDLLREGHVFDGSAYVGSLYNPDGTRKNPGEATLLKFQGASISTSQFNALVEKIGEDNCVRIPLTYKAAGGEEELEATLDRIAAESVIAARQGKQIIVDDSSMSLEDAPIFTVLAVGAIHSKLMNEGLRHATSIIVRTGDSVDNHDSKLLADAGANVVNPWLAERTIERRYQAGLYEPQTAEEKSLPLTDWLKRYYEAQNFGIKKIMSKMGITTLTSIVGGCQFEALGLSERLMKKYFNASPSIIGGHDFLQLVAKQQRLLKDIAREPKGTLLPVTGQFGWSPHSQPHGMDAKSAGELRAAVKGANQGAIETCIAEVLAGLKPEGDADTELQLLYKIVDATAKRRAEEDLELQLANERERVLQKTRSDAEAEAAYQAAKKEWEEPDYKNEIIAVKQTLRRSYDEIAAGTLSAEKIAKIANNHYLIEGYRRYKEFVAHVYKNGAASNLITIKGLAQGDPVQNFDGPFTPIPRPAHIRDLFVLQKPDKSISLDQVEAAEKIFPRFYLADMSIGALSEIAHRSLAVAANRIGALSGTGEGGLPKKAYQPGHEEENPYAHQIASGRFGVDLEYMAKCKRINIKIAQGAKPGEGGQLMGIKVVGIIPELRHAEAGTTLISPPPNHDMYSIEDLHELIYTLKKVNPDLDIDVTDEKGVSVFLGNQKGAPVAVKLVAKSGVGTVAAGVVKTGAEVVQVSGHSGGTGASPLGSVQYAGLPWELGTSITHQTLVEHYLREQTRLATDGGLKSGRDVIIAAILGGEEFAIGTAAMIALGCLYIKQCHTNKCPVGIATQDENLIAKFPGHPDDVVNYLKFLADEVREIMAEMGVKSIEELVGRYDLLKVVPGAEEKYGVSFDKILPKENLTVTSKLELNERHPVLDNIDDYIFKMNPGLIGSDGTFNITHEQVTDDKGHIVAHISKDTNGALIIDARTTNEDRAIGTRMSSEILNKWGMKSEFNKKAAAPAVQYKLSGSAVGNSLGSWLHPAVSISAERVNDYAGRGLSGGTIVVCGQGPAGGNNVLARVAGNETGFGMIDGKMFFNGYVNDRFGVRQSGGLIVADKVGANASEYKTGGTTVILSCPGANYGAASTGGVSFVRATATQIERVRHKGASTIKHTNIGDVADSYKYKTYLKSIIQEHFELSGSAEAEQILANWEVESENFRVVWSSEKDAPAMPNFELAA